MKKFFLFFAFCAMVFTVTNAANATTITFDAYVNNGSGNGEVTGNEWISDGIIFYTPDLALNLGTTTGSSPNSLGADLLVPEDFDGELVFEFTGNQFADDLSFTIFNTPFQAMAYDVNDVLLTTIVSGSAFTQLFNFTGFDVNRVNITGDFYAIDDVNFGTLQTSSSVPEPGTMLLLGFGLIGLFGIKKKNAC